MKKFVIKRDITDADLEKMIDRGGFSTHYMQFMSDGKLHVVFVKECDDTPPVAAPASASVKRITSSMQKIVLVPQPMPRSLAHFPTAQNLRQAAFDEMERRYIEALDEGIAMVKQASKSFTKHQGGLDD